jgi:hypothetical protein
MRCPWLPLSSETHSTEDTVLEKVQLDHSGGSYALKLELSKALASEAAALLAALLTIDHRALGNRLTGAFLLAWHCASVHAVPEGPRTAFCVCIYFIYLCIYIYIYICIYIYIFAGTWPCYAVELSLSSPLQQGWFSNCLRFSRQL